VKQVEVSAADIARIARVRPSAVSNWRRRHDDFPRPVSGSDSSPRFDLAAVEAWLRAQGRMPEISADERLWQAFESARGVMPTGDALVAAGLLLYYLHRHPGTPVPYDSAGVRRVLDEAEHALAFGNSVVAGLIGLRRPFDPGSRETTMLHAVAQAASGDAPARVFEYLCSRALDGGARTGLTVTPPELADLMLDLTGDSPRRLLDPACGSGTILLAAAKRGYSRVEGQELDRSLALVSALRLAFTGASFDVSAGDSLRADAYPRPSADAVVCSPPFADRNWGAEDLADDPRWEYGTPPRLEPELAWVQHALAHVAPGGPVVMLMPPAAAARPSGRRIRRALVADGALRAVISLPPKLAAHYALALQIWVLSRPEPDRAHSHVLLVDASGFTTRTAQAADAISTWDGVRAVVTPAWTAFHESPQRVADVSDVVIAVPTMDLLGEEADLTPARYLRPPGLVMVSQTGLTDRRNNLASRLAELARLLPDPPRPRSGDGPPHRDASLEELAQTGALVIRRAVSRTASSERDLVSERAKGRILTSQDIARAVPPSGTDEIIIDEVHNPTIRAGDVLVPLIGRRLTARVAAGKDVGAYLSPTVYLIRPDITALDPWFLAGVLSSAGGDRQAARMASTFGDRIRFDPRRVRIPLLPIEDQRAYGESFRRLWDFARTLRIAYDEGTDLVRDLIDATAVSFLDAQDSAEAREAARGS
jgi:type I restriction-modification system DNA methylase subunit